MKADVKFEKEFSKRGLILIYPGYQNEAKQYQYNRITEKLTKKNVAEIYAKYIMKKVYNS